MSQLWQHPFVNVFKHFNISTWMKSTKEGEVTPVIDKTLKCTVYKITGQIPAGNYIHLPKASSQSLALTGRYLYLLFRPLPGKYFVVHIDAATEDSLVVRISFSNLFKEFKATSTWIQFPYICNPAKGSVAAFTAVGSKDESGPAPQLVRWTVLCLDLQQILSTYLSRKYSCLKGIRLCANMCIRNIFTSDLLFEPGISVGEGRKQGLSLVGLSPMPREMSFHLKKGNNWHDYYDIIRFPSSTKKIPFDSIQYHDPKDVRRGSPATSPIRVMAPDVDISKCVSDRVSMIQKLTSSQKQHRKVHQVTSHLPIMRPEDCTKGHNTTDIYVCAEKIKSINFHKDFNLNKQGNALVNSREPIHQRDFSYKSLQPDPILKLKNIVGFGGCNFRDILWTMDGKTIIYCCNAIVVAMNVSTKEQSYFIGHTDKISCLSMNGNTSLLASGQTGHMSAVRIWKVQARECLVMVKSHNHSLKCLSFSQRGTLLCGVGKDLQGRNLIIVWDTSAAVRKREVKILAKAHTDVDIVKMLVLPFDDTRLVSCGRDNIRFWRVKERALRSAPVVLGDYHSMDFTDVCFQLGCYSNRDPDDHLIYACSKSGHIFEINYENVAVCHVRRLLPVSSRKERAKTNSETGIAINCMCVNESFCVTGSMDGFLCLWPLDFNNLYLEAEHQGPVTGVRFSNDGHQVLTGTDRGNLGILDISTRSYTTVMRSHTGQITSLAVDVDRQYLITVSQDRTIRVWNLDSLQQLFDFTTPRESPTTVCYHPRRAIFACGFEDGFVRVFSISNNSIIKEQKKHKGKIIGLVYSPNGDYLYSACSLGTLAVYRALSDTYEVSSIIMNAVAHSDSLGPDALTVSPDGRRVAFVGPSHFTVTVADGCRLEEILRIDVTRSNHVNHKVTVDTAKRVLYSPANIGHLLVTTSSNKLLKFSALDGRLLAEIDHIHRDDCTSLTMTRNGKYLVTAGDRVLKVWDYHMKLDINFQVFIGHSEDVQKVLFTSDGCDLFTVGEAIFIWKFLGFRPQENSTEKRSLQEFNGEINTNQNCSCAGGDREDDMDACTPRRCVPKATQFQSPAKIDIFSPVRQMSVRDEDDSAASADDWGNSEDELQEVSASNNNIIEVDKGRGAMHTCVSPKTNHLIEEGTKPSVHKHFFRRRKKSSMAQRLYAVPPDQAGLQLRSVVGYNGNGRSNMTWQPDTGVFVYTIGCIVVIQDLTSGCQKHLIGHVEEVSTLALQHDSQVLASASGPAAEASTSQIYLWDVEKATYIQVLSRHNHEVVCLVYSQDDRFLVSVGDYHDREVVVWCTKTHQVLAASTVDQPIHELRWDPYRTNEFASVGHGGSVFFWLLDEAADGKFSLNIHKAELPDQPQLTSLCMNSSPTDLTAVEYGRDSVLFVATSTGKILAWDTQQNSCFLHWEADNSEIGVMASKSSYLVTGSVSGSLRLWSVSGVTRMKLLGSTDNRRVQVEELLMEDEMVLDGAVIATAFDDMLVMGIIGTDAGTLWYVNWTERTCIHLVSGHMQKVNDLSVCSDTHLASCCDDGTLRLWSINSCEQTLQFQVVNQPCTCLAVAPAQMQNADLSINKSRCLNGDHLKYGPHPCPFIVAGYGDGTVRMFNIDKAEMVLKTHPHAAFVTAIAFSTDGHMILSGARDGLVAITNPATGMTVRIISDHHGAPVINIDVTFKQDQDVGVSAPLLWLATSGDRRVSVWAADWTTDCCELVDWLTFPAPTFAPDGAMLDEDDQALCSQLPPSLAQFSPKEPDIIVYAGYGMHKNIHFYSLSQKKIIRTTSLTQWSTCLDLALTNSLIVMGTNDHLVRLMDYHEGSFQDFTGHNGQVGVVKFSTKTKLLFSAAYNEVFIWEVVV